ncbi:MAG: hypothetical protein ABSA31_08620 [Acidimicrobiales bacterium]|jgi:hypothetical protein
MARVDARHEKMEPEPSDAVLQTIAPVGERPILLASASEHGTVRLGGPARP